MNPVSNRGDARKKRKKMERRYDQAPKALEGHCRGGRDSGLDSAIDFQ
jgi:hypothetical protein